MATLSRLDVPPLPANPTAYAPTPVDLQPYTYKYTPPANPVARQKVTNHLEGVLTPAPSSFQKIKNNLPGRKTEPVEIDNLRVNNGFFPDEEYTFPENRTPNQRTLPDFSINSDNIVQQNRVAAIDKLRHRSAMALQRKQSIPSLASVGSYNPTATQVNEFTITQPKQNPYKNQYGKASTTPMNFRNHFKNKTYNEIIVGKMKVLNIPHIINYTVPNKINQNSNDPYDFVDLSNGKQVDMIHFLVVGPRGHLLGTANELKQIFSSPKSAFYPQDLYSNRLGIMFFQEYEERLKKHPEMISEYIYEFLTNPLNL